MHKFIILTYFLFLSHTQQCANNFYCLYNSCVSLQNAALKDLIQPNCNCLVTNCVQCSNSETCDLCDSNFEYDIQTAQCLSRPKMIQRITIPVMISIIVFCLICLVFMICICCIIFNKKRITQNQTILKNSSIKQATNRQIEFQNSDFIQYSDHSNQCSICLQYNIDILTDCCHYFHLNCITNWNCVKQKKICPNCLNLNFIVKKLCKVCNKFTTNINLCDNKCNNKDHNACFAVEQKCHVCFKVEEVTK